MLPPGPEGHRIVGSLPGYKGPKTNLQWAKQYGAIYRVNMAGKHIVYLNTIQLVEKYLEGAEGEKYLGRPPGPAAIGEGLLFGNGEKWVNNKAAFMRALHTETFIPALESVIEFELGILVPILQAKNGMKMLVANVLLEACVNVIVGLLLGSSLPERDRQRRQVLLVAKRLARCNLASPLTQISLEYRLMRIPLSLLCCTPIVNIPRVARSLHGLLRKWIRECRGQTKPSVPEGVVNITPMAKSTVTLEPGDEYLDQNDQLTSRHWHFSKTSPNEDKESILQRILNQPEFLDVTESNEAELIQSLTDLFFGGVTSTLSAIEFILMYLSKHPDCRQKAQAEIDKVAGCQPIRFSMREEMPYVHACIIEGLRLGSVTPSSLPHIATESTEVEGYTISKGEVVMASIYTLHRDPEFYKDPEEFRPDRHMSSSGSFIKPRSLRPYGIGARLCAGISIAEIEIFLFITNLLRQFDIQPADRKRDSDMKSHMRIVHRLIKFRCIFTARKK